MQQNLLHQTQVNLLEGMKKQDGIQGPFEGRTICICWFLVVIGLCAEGIPITRTHFLLLLPGSQVYVSFKIMESGLTGLTCP